MSTFDTHDIDRSGPPAKRQRRVWIWIVVGTAAGILLSCAGCFGVLAWIGTAGPETAVYSGERVPSRFTETMREIGALDDGEQIAYFYSDAVVDIKSSFYFVSDRRVVVYSDTARPPLVEVSFDEIESVELYREESFFIDSEIVLELADGSSVSFPVSSEREGDVRFAEAIEARLDDAR
jgi:hypothetical protein